MTDHVRGRRTLLWLTVPFLLFVRRDPAREPRRPRDPRAAVPVLLGADERDPQPAGDLAGVARRPVLRADEAEGTDVD